MLYMCVPVHKTPYGQVSNAKNIIFINMTLLPRVVSRKYETLIVRSDIGPLWKHKTRQRMATCENNFPVSFAVGKKKKKPGKSSWSLSFLSQQVKKP